MEVDGETAYTHIPGQILEQTSNTRDENCVSVKETTKRSKQRVKWEIERHREKQ